MTQRPSWLLQEPRQSRAPRHHPPDVQEELTDAYPTRRKLGMNLPDQGNFLPRDEKVSSDGGSDWTRYHIIIDGEPRPPLPQRQAMLTMIQKLHERGIRLEAVSKLLTLPHARASRATGRTSVDRKCAARAGVNDPERYFTGAPFVEDGKTYVLTKMWGRRTETTLSALRDTFATAEFNFKAED